MNICPECGKKCRKKHCSKECAYKHCRSFINGDGILVKRCSKCSTIYPLKKGFYKEADRPEGYTSNCKHCINERSYKYAKTEVAKLSCWKYRQTIIARFKYAYRKSKYRGIKWNLTYEEYLQLVDNKCHYCYKLPGNVNIGLDRKNNDKGYELSNVVPCCYRCNVTFSNFYNYDEKLFLAETIRKIEEIRARPDVDCEMPHEG
jgi:hypothetical protein